MLNPFRLFRDLMRQPLWIPLWVAFLMLINIASVAFWGDPLAKVIFITFMVSAALMMGLYARIGFSKLLGLGHILWVPLLVYVVFQIPRADAGFKTYLVALSVALAVSLAFDITDVWQYLSNRERPRFGS